MKFELYNGERKLDVEVTTEGEDLKVAFDGKQFVVRLAKASAGDAILAHVGREELVVSLEDETESTLRLLINGKPVTLGRAQAQLQSGSAGEESSAPTAAEHDALLSPLFGKVISVDAKVGDSVTSGQSLVVLEAMKMESVLRADGNHKIKEVLVKEGEGVQKGQVLMRFA